MTHPERIKLAEEHERFAQVLRQPDGTVIESKPKNSHQKWSEMYIESCAFSSSHEVRLKPEPKYRPMTEEDFLGVKEQIWFINIKVPYSKASISDINADCIVTSSNNSKTWRQLFEDENLQYSIDGRATWHRFRVEVTE